MVYKQKVFGAHGFFFFLLQYFRSTIYIYITQFFRFVFVNVIKQFGIVKNYDDEKLVLRSKEKLDFYGAQRRKRGRLRTKHRNSFQRAKKM